MKVIKGQPEAVMKVEMTPTNETPHIKLVSTEHERDVAQPEVYPNAEYYRQNCPRSSSLYIYGYTKAFFANGNGRHFPPRLT